MDTIDTSTVLITGCNGLVGSFIARKFLQQGCRVRGLRRAESNLSLLSDVKDQIEWVNGDVLDIPSLEDAVQGVNYVVHAAAIVSFAPDDQDRMLAVNVEGTANVVNICLKKRIGKLCFVSSVAALGRTVPSEAELHESPELRREIVISEDAKWENSRYNTHYAKSKYLAELEVWRGIAEGLPAVIVNPSVVLGAGDWHRSSARIFRYVWEQKPFYAEGTVNYVDVRDVADIIFSLVHSEISAKRYILSAGNVSYRDLLNRIADCFSKKRPSIRVGPLAASLIWRLEWMRSLITRKEPLISRETARLSGLFFRYNSERVQQDLYFQFRSLDNTLQWCCRELKQLHSKDLKSV